MNMNKRKAEIEHWVTNCEHCISFLLELHEKESDPAIGNRIWNHALAVRGLITLLRTTDRELRETSSKLLSVEEQNKLFKQEIYADYISKEVAFFKRSLVDRISELLEDEFGE